MKYSSIKRGVMILVRRSRFLLCFSISYYCIHTLKGTLTENTPPLRFPDFSAKADFGVASVPYVARFKNICISHQDVPTLVPNYGSGDKELIQKKKTSVHFSQTCPPQFKKKIVNSAPSDFTFIEFDLEEIIGTHNLVFVDGLTVHLTLKTNFAHFFMETYWRFFVLLNYLSKFGIQRIDKIFVSPLMNVAKHDLQRHNIADLDMDQQLHGPVKKVTHFSFAALRIALSLHKKLVGHFLPILFHDYSTEHSSKKKIYCFEELWSISPLRSEDTRNMYHNGILKKSPLILKDPFNGEYGVRRLILNFRAEITRVFGVELQQGQLQCIKRLLIYTREDSGQRILPSENLRMIKSIISKNLNLDLSIVTHLSDLSFIEQVELFSKTDFLITPHGSSSLNELFMPIGSVVFESMPSCFEISITHETGISASLRHQYKFIESLECKNRSLDSICQHNRNGKMPTLPGRGWSSFDASKGHQRCPSVSFNIRIFSIEIDELIRQKKICSID